MKRSQTSAAPPTPAAVYQGPLGKTRREHVRVTSSQGRTFRASIFSQVNLTQDASLRQVLLDENLTQVTDPWTGEQHSLAQAVVVHNEALRLLVLLLPDSLRHQELVQRQALLAALDKADGELPDYVREFKVAFGAQAFAQFEAQAQAAHKEAQATPKEAPDPLAKERQALEAQRKALEAQSQDLKTQKQSLEAERLNLTAQAARLAEQEEALRKGRLVPKQDDEPTTVVPREVIYNLPGALAASRNKKEIPADPEPSWGDNMGEGWELETPAAAKPEATLVQMSPSQDPVSADQAALTRPSEEPSTPSAPVSRSAPSDLAVTDDTPRTFNRLRASNKPYYNTLQKGQVLFSYRLSDDKLALFAQQQPQLLLQVHDLESFPLVTLLLALMEEDQATDILAWPLDLRQSGDVALLETLGKNFAPRVALYGEDLKLRQVMQFQQPLELNALHLLEIVRTRLAQGTDWNWDKALQDFHADTYESVGSMRHNFHQDSFNNLDSPSRTRLAAGIVGYWSQTRTFRYLIENRAFPLAWFDVIQKRVIHAAARFGICLAPELRHIAVDLNLADDEASFVRNLASTWAQVALGLGSTSNDLDDLDTWHNWQDLIEALGSLGSSLDEELTDLASAALGRARDYGQAHDIPVEITPEVEALVLPHHGNAEGNPGAGTAPIPGQKELETQDSATLRKLLTDPDKRLPASSVLISRGDHDATLDVLVTTEEMSDDEIELLSEVLSLYAPRLEETYLEALKLDSPTISYLCGFALASIPSAKGLEVLLAMIKNDTLDAELFGEVVFAWESFTEVFSGLLAGADKLTADHPWIKLLAAWRESRGADTMGAFDEAPEALKLLS